MTINTQKLVEIKERIISYIEKNGPSLPIKISKEINSQPLFTSAFLSELYSEKKLKMSNMKVGSSPLYYLPGQEKQLENFSQHLNTREKEALQLIQKFKLLEDESQTPVVRVALRSIKDFANPIKIRVGEQSKIFWRYFTLEDSELRELAKKLVPKNKTSNSLQINTPSESKPSPQLLEISKDVKLDQDSISSNITKESDPINKYGISNQSAQANTKTLLTQPNTDIKSVESRPSLSESTQSTLETKKQIQTETKPSEEPKQKPKTATIKKPQKTHQFPSSIKEYLEAKDVEILSTILEKKKELEAKIRTDTLFGKQEYYLIAKDKKSITDNDLILALQKAREERSIALILSPGKLNTKAQEYLKQWKSLLKFEKINI